ncbi:hypothetical protein IJX73_05760 [bacterium]|nr:hypothetical protein [bacterium]
MFLLKPKGFVHFLFLFSIADKRKRSAIAKSQRFADLAPAHAKKKEPKEKEKTAYTLLGF